MYLNMQTIKKIAQYDIVVLYSTAYLLSDFIIFYYFHKHPTPYANLRAR